MSLRQPGQRAALLPLTLFFVSGLCGLVYEVVWSRLLVLVFGSTAYAVATVLAVFMGGLALGSHLGGRAASRVVSPLAAYGNLEIAVGVCAALFLPFLAVAQRVHVLAFPSVFESELALNVLRVGLSCVLLLLPTTLMGATVPLLTEAVAPRARAGGAVGTIYAVNTFGAAAGCFLGAFVAIPRLGLSATILSAAAANVLLGLAARRLAGGAPSAEGRLSQPPPEESPAVAGSRFQATLAMGGFGVSGLLALVCEVAWTRALVLVFGTSVYAFATMLTAYLLGLGAGSAAMGRVLGRIKRPFVAFCAMEALIGVSVLATTPIVGRLPDLFLRLLRTDRSWGAVTLAEFGVCLLVMIGPTFLSGALFPLVSRLGLGEGEGAVGRTVGEVYALNTLGGIVGSLLAGFALIPWLGTEGALLAAGAGSVVLGAALLPFTGRGFRRGGALLGAGLAAAALASVRLLPSWDPIVMNSGVYVYGQTLAKKADTVAEAMSGYRLVFCREDHSGVVSVFERQNRFLRVNGKTDGGNTSDNYTQVLLGLLPVLYSPDPRQALVIGLGTGITLGSTLDDPSVSADCVEISPSVVEASRYFDDVSGGPFTPPRCRTLVLDGRTWLLAMPRLYDVITSEPSNPWQTGNANLFTTDFFRIAAKRLKPGGVFCQWLPYYQMEGEHFRLLVKSFQSVFPQVHIWVASSDAVLVGSTGALAMDYGKLEERLALPSVAGRLAPLGIQGPEDLLSFFWLDENGARSLASSANELNSDDRPIIEFSAPKYLLAGVQTDLFLDLLRGSLSAALPVSGAPDAAALQVGRLERRAEYLRTWGVPEQIVSEMLLQNAALSQ